jgi:hypothetical protein
MRLMGMIIFLLTMMFRKEMWLGMSIAFPIDTWKLQIVYGNIMK